MDKLFNEYAKWCQENNKDPLSEESIKEFKNFKKAEEEKEKAAVKEKEENRKNLVEKQKEIFKMMTEYVGIKVKYDDEEDFFNLLDSVIKATVGVAAIQGKDAEIEKLLDVICF